MRPILQPMQTQRTVLRARRVLLSFFIYLATVASHSHGASLDLSPLGEEKAHAWMLLMEAMRADPRSELTHTIERFSQTGLIPDPRCLYPARWRLLQHKIPAANTPAKCAELEMWKLRLKAEKITIIFAAQYISNPSSAMGHTFLKFTDLSTEPYLHQTLGFAAQVDDDISAFSYVIKGLSGGFEGIFPFGPYYEKVHEYTNMEQRDVWEFTLSLSPEEREYLSEILWEMKFAAKIPYFFAGRNCSYQILLALQAARPSAKLKEQLPLHVIPIETVKALNAAGMLEDAFFRPSLRKKLLANFRTLSQQERRQLFAARNSPGESVDHLTQPTIETVLDYLSMIRHRNLGVLSDTEQKFERAALVRRADLGKSPEPIIETPPSPLASHKPIRFDFTLSQITNLGHSFGLKIKPGAHGAMDKDVGYLSHSSFEFFQLAIDYFPGLARWQAREFVIEEIAVSNPMNSIDPQASFRLRSEFRKENGPSCQDCNLFRLHGAFGGTWEVGTTSLIQAMANADFDASEALGKRVRLWPGIEFNFLYSLATHAKFVVGSSLSQELMEPAKLQRFRQHVDLRIFDILPRLNLGARTQYEALLTSGAATFEATALLNTEY